MPIDLNSPLPHPENPWDARFGFFWYNDQEIFHDSEDDLNRKAESMAHAGINHVITFSCTHFRWSFRRHWELLTNVLAKIVRACHRYGIYVTEHHSSHLTFNPLDEGDDEYMDRILHVRGSSRQSWAYLRYDCDADPIIIDGKSLSSFRQIDGRTGKWARSNYRGWCLCFNNPDYRRAYLSYLETLYQIGIDGIMTDDVQWFGEGHACACTHCRQRFREKTGAELPPPGRDWEYWHGNYEEPSFRAWLDFKLRSNEDFHRSVKEHYESLGRRLLRPNYVSHALNNNPTSYSLETLPHLDWIFQESCFSSIIRYCWADWALETMHRFAVGRRRNIPAMNMFYPDRSDSMRFCWGLAQSWGVSYLATPEGKSMNQYEKTLRDFERRHARLLRNPVRIAQIGFYDSRWNRELYQHVNSRSLRAMKSWMMACYMNCIPFDLFQKEELNWLSAYKIIVLNEIAILSEEEIVEFRRFVANGGTLVWSGNSGSLDESGESRRADSLSKLWDTPHFKNKADGAATQTIPIQRGKLILAAIDFAVGDVERCHNADRWQPYEFKVPFAPLGESDLQARRQAVEFLATLLAEDANFKIENCPGGVIVTAFIAEDSKSLVVHLVNASETLNVRAESKVGHSDLIPFPSHAGKPAINIEVKLHGHLSELRLSRATLYSLHQWEGVPLEIKANASTVSLTIDPRLIEDYALVEIG
ncbi:beta-galactosidase trimerization domain-containing protein [candidate division KSB1 bacterium]|nr:beta-galactosidase trimerization domain-containing protein [candidate division KSB1 bacterium]